MKKRTWTKDNLDQLRGMVDEKSNQELAQIYSITSNGIRRVLSRYNIKRKAPKNSKELEFRYEYLRKDLDKPCKVCTSHHKNRGGYLSTKRGNKRMNLHTAIYEDTFGKIPPGEVVRHKCDNPPCCEITHLEVGTTQDNMDDKVSRNRQTKGTDVNTAKLAEIDVVKIKIALVRKTKVKTLSEIFKIDTATICDIKKGRSWRHITIDRDRALKKRTWHYIQKPPEYGIVCTICKGENIWWSEYRGAIWCYSCGIDDEGDKGIFGGPVPIQAAGLLGMNFDVYDMENKRILKYGSPESIEVMRRDFDGLDKE